MVIRILTIFILVSVLGACGEGGPDPEKLAREITRYAKSAISVRQNQGEHDVVFTEKTDSLIVAEKASKGGQIVLRLRKWHCVDQEPGKCGRLSVPVEYVVHPRYVDPASIRRSPPDADKGEAGRAVEFSCDAGAPVPCLEFAGIGGFGRYKTCEERSCASGRGAIRQSVETGAEAFGFLRVGQGRQTIECASEKKCAEVEVALRTLVEFVAVVSKADTTDKDGDGNTGNTDKSKPQNDPLANMFVDAFNDTNEASIYRAKRKDGKTYAVYQLKQIKAASPGKIGATVARCLEKKKGNCRKPSEFKSYDFEWSMSDIDFENSRFFHADGAGDPAKTNDANDASAPPEPGSTFAIMAMCKENKGCVKFAGAKGKQSSLILPCKSPEDCISGFFTLFLEASDGGHKAEETASKGKTQKSAKSLSEKQIDKLVGTLDKAARGAVFAEENADEKRKVSYAAGHGVGVADKVFHKGESVLIGPDGRLRIETRVCAENEDEPCDDKAEWDKHILYLALDKLDPASVEALGDARRKVGAAGGGKPVDMWSYNIVLDKSGSEIDLSGWAVFAACRRGETACAEIPGAKAYGLDAFFPCTNKKQCKKAAEALSKLVAFAATDEFHAWREAREKAAREPAKIETRKDAENAARRVSQALSGNAYGLYVQDIKESFLITPAGAALTDDNSLVIDVGYCRKQGRHWYSAPFGAAPCGAAPVTGAARALKLGSVVAGSFEIIELPSETDGMFAKFACRGDQVCYAMPIGDGRQLTSREFFAPCKDLEVCTGLARDIAGLALWAREDVAWLEELGDEMEKVAKDGQSAETSPAELVAEIARHAKGAQIKYHDDETSEFVLVRADGVSLAPDGRLQVEMSYCAYPGDADDMPLFQKYHPEDADQPGYWGRKSEDFVDYWNPKEKGAGAGNRRKDAQRCERADAWTSVRNIVAPGDLDWFLATHIHSYDEKGSRKEGFDAAASSFSVLAECGTEQACVEVPGGMADSLEIPCPDKAGCEAIVTAIDELPIATAIDELAIAASPEAGDRRAETAADDPFTLDDFLRQATGQSPENLNRLGSLASSAAIRLRVTGGGSALRLMRGAGAAAFDTDGALIVRREVCSALLAAGLPQTNECQVKTLFRSYDLKIDPRRLAPASVAVMEGDKRKGESGLWVGAACRPGEACARLVGLDYPKDEAEFIMAGFGETASAPKIRIPCADREQCEQAAGALRAMAGGQNTDDSYNWDNLIRGLTGKSPEELDEIFNDLGRNDEKIEELEKLFEELDKVGKETRSWEQKGTDQSTRETHSLSTAAAGLIGVWAFESPFGERIKIEFRAGGTFIHTHPSNSFQGTWTAANGAYSIDAPAGNYADNGTYRLVDKNTVIFNGRFGTSVWKRQ